MYSIDSFRLYFLFSYAAFVLKRGIHQCNLIKNAHELNL